QDLDLAEKLLDEAGWTDSDGDGIRDKLIDGKRVPFEFTILVSQASTIGIQACTLLRESLQYVGVRCNIKLLETTVFFEKTQNKEFQAYFGGWGTGTDPDSLTNIFASGEGRNYISYSNPEVDKLFEEGRKEFDR